MGTKRPHPSSETSRPPPKRSRSTNTAHSNSKPTGPTPTRIYPKSTYPINDLKSQIRALTRLLSRADDTSSNSKNKNAKHHDLPATVRVEKERALASAERELATRLRARRRAEMIERWHKVRFFDRRKADRRLKKARKELAELKARDGRGEEVEGLEDAERRVRDGEVAVQYAVSAPLDWNYVSLFPRREKGEGAGGGEDVGEERVGDEEMWELVKRCMKDGTLEALREGRLTDEKGKLVKADEKAKVIGSGKSKQKAEKEAHSKRTDDAEEESDNESGGGFFE